MNHVTVKIEFKNSHSEGKPREEFWRSIVKNYQELPRDLSDRTIDRLETDLCSRFSDQLQWKLKHHFDEEARPLVVRTKVLSYSSLLLGLEFWPVEKIIDLFDNNFDYFKVFLEGYLPEIFQSSLYDDMRPIHIEPSDLHYKLKATSEFKKMFAKSTYSAQQKFGSTKEERALWLLSLAKSPLLLPFILALLILFVAFNKLDTYHDMRNTQFDPVLDRYDQIINHYENLLNAKNDLVKSDTTSTSQKVN